MNAVAPTSATPKRSGFDASALCAQIRRLPYCDASDIAALLTAIGARVANDRNCDSKAKLLVDVLDDTADLIEAIDAGEVNKMEIDE
jgi:hypothetical protein